jgi:hypothetical protein
MLDAFRNYFSRNTTQVLGHELQPLTLGHVFVLDLIDSPYTHSSEDVSFPDICFTVWLLSKRFSDLEKAIKTATLSKLKKQTGRMVKGKTLPDFAKANSEIVKHINDAIQLPERIKSAGSKNRNIATPWALYINSILQKETKFSENEIWEMPIGKALAYYLSVSELNGDESIPTEKDIQIWKETENITYQDLVKKGIIPNE